MSCQGLEADVADALPMLQINGVNLNPEEGAIVAFEAVVIQYVLSWGVRGDNMPEKAKELGYVTSKKLWPEMGFVKYEDFLKDVADGKVEPVHADRRAGYQQTWEVLKEEKRV